MDNTYNKGELIRTLLSLTFRNHPITTAQCENDADTSIARVELTDAIDNSVVGQMPHLPHRVRRPWSVDAVSTIL